jgi:hypothetical protein
VKKSRSGDGGPPDHYSIATVSFSILRASSAVTISPLPITGIETRFFISRYQGPVRIPLNFCPRFSDEQQLHRHRKLHQFLRF